MNNNGSRNWLLWLAVILAVVAAVYFVRNRMQSSATPAQEVTVLAEEVSVETQVDAVPSAESTEAAETTAELMEKMEEALNTIPGVTYEFTQPVQMRFNELMTGVRSDVAVKIFGEDIDMLVSKGEEVVQLINGIEGVSDVKAERVAGLPQITIRYNKDKLALYGLKIGDLNKVVRMGFAGETAGVVYEGEKRFDLVVRLANDSRKDIENLKALFVTLPSGNQIPLEQIADVKYEDGPMQISRENGKRRIVVGFNVRGADVKTVVETIQAKLDEKLKLPEGYYTTYGGQFENLIMFLLNAFDIFNGLFYHFPVKEGLTTKEVDFTVLTITAHLNEEIYRPFCHIKAH